MGRRDRITTVGIDVGTSTTKLVISELKVANTAGRTRVPRLEIVERRVVYRSPLYRTPLLNERLIDIPGVWSIVEQEYRRAGVSMREVDTGAVIITGETANKENAREMVVSLAHRAGDFVVATAGPDLEGILAGKGSGAWQWSKKTGRTIANVDIGGGTANIAVFSGGEVSGTCTLHIGGRMVEFAGGTIARISPTLVEWMRMEGLSLDVGQRVDGGVVDMLRKITDGLARSLAAVLRGEVGLAEEPLFVNHPPNWADPPDCVMFSGGVGGMMEELTRSRAVSDYAALVWDRAQAGDGFADIGVPLAHSLLASPE
ncbi:MAG: ethanolamine ammonia-lyase reactivating factor EutA, partial [Alicyclobacillaceae bacterium]|nr:ethanolamine ammonia-lyase reactivating factor EutA [Alicyclobacillaceae bacterium]